jgi:hypothetical protein
MHFLMLQLVHHRLGNLVIASTAPDINNLVVALANRYQTGGVLLLDFLHLGFGSSMICPFLGTSMS